MDDRNNPYGSPYGGHSQYGQNNDGDYTHDYGSGRNYTYSSARDYAAAGQLGGRHGRYGGREQRDYRDDWNRNRPDWRSQGYDEGRPRYGGGDRHRSFSGYGDYSGEEHGRDWGRNRGNRAGGYDEERGFFERAGDEVRSWFGDEAAERRRRMDQHYDEWHAREKGRGLPDNDYSSWRRSRIAEFDRDYDEYRRENAQRFRTEFDTWRTERAGQREALRRVTEHMEVVGSDDSHVGTVDKARGDHILLTKSDTDAEGRHHSIPSRWIASVDDKVRLRKTAEEAKNHWRDEERSGALFGEKEGRAETDDRTTNQVDQNWRSDRNLNRSFSDTY